MPQQNALIYVQKKRYVTVYEIFLFEPPSDELNAEFAFGGPSVHNWIGSLVQTMFIDEMWIEPGLVEADVT